MPKDAAARIEKLRDTLRHHRRLYYVLDQPTIRAARSGAGCGHDVHLHTDGRGRRAERRGRLPAKKALGGCASTKKGKLKEMSCCHNLEEYLDAHIGAGQRMAGYSSAKTTGLYGPRNDDVSLDEVKRIGI